MLGFHMPFWKYKRMRVLWPSLAAAFALLFAFPSSLALAKDNDVASQAAYERFLTQAERLYAAVNDGKPKEASSRLASLEHQFRNLPMQGIATAEGIRALAKSLAEMKRTTAAITPDERKWKSGAAELRLAADELVHPDRPIWHTYRSVILNDLTKLEEAMPQSTTLSGPVPEPVTVAVNRLIEHYETIRTAAALHSEPWILEKSDSAVRYAERIVGAETPSSELLGGILAPLREAMTGLFPGQKPTSAAVVPPLAAPPSWGWSAMMGSFIVTVLTWVGWKRYKTDERTGIGPDKRRGSPPEQEDAAEKLLNRWKGKK